MALMCRQSRASGSCAIWTVGGVNALHTTAGMASQLVKCTAYTSTARLLRSSKILQPRIYSGKPSKRPQMAATAAAAKQHVPAEVVVQKQLEAYNARDLEAFMDLLAGLAV